MSEPTINVRSDASNGSCRLDIAGEIDMLTAPAIEDAITDAIERDGTQHVTIGLEDVTFMDSTGLRALLTACRRAEAAQVELALSVAPGPVDTLLSLAGVRDWFRYA